MLRRFLVGEGGKRTARVRRYTAYRKRNQSGDALLEVCSLKEILCPEEQWKFRMTLD